MITIPEAVETIIRDSFFLEEALDKRIINLSSLARLIRNNVEEMTYKNVTEGAIVMALKRLDIRKKTKKNISKIFTDIPDIIVRLNLTEFTVNNESFTINMHKKILELVDGKNNLFLTITEGVFETTIIASRDLQKTITSIIGSKNIIFKLENLSSITIKLPKENVEIPGIYYFILKTLAWENINISEVVSTLSEFTVVLEDKNVDRAFSRLKDSLTYKNKY